MTYEQWLMLTYKYPKNYTYPEISEQISDHVKLNIVCHYDDYEYSTTYRVSLSFLSDLQEEAAFMSWEVDHHGDMPVSTNGVHRACLLAATGIEDSELRFTCVKELLAII